ncbi:NIF-domain-containing protein [Myriangium duriaei CBS 260.36]|uniref:Mitochondrial import inner membrane translocase subunit TIM50 n=1 Tax=Myriangium duriaei CBS 260.36 TaxID=1168546 RepID=A0A9P4J092_9PEZI|nr:NIF-domain-containing protein [Myriangium duriaei CBS 260.36]
MLAQAARSASRLALRQPHNLHRYAPASSLSLALRSYAKYSKPSFNQPKGDAPKQTPSSSSTGSARQTSPGTSFPKDQTWTPQDSIKFGGPAAAHPAPSSQHTTASDPKRSEQTAEFNESPNPNANTIPQGQPGPNPKVVDPSDPTPHKATDPQSANEELRGPQSSEVNTEPEGNEPPKGPLPDLRQGIPSTFDMEFGTGKGRVGAEDAGAASESSGAGGDELPGAGRSRRNAEEEEEFNEKDYETSSDRARARLARYMYLSLATSVLLGGAYFGRPYDKDEEAPSGINPSDLEGWAPGTVWTRIRSRMTGSVEYYTEPTSRKLLPEMPKQQQFPFTLVLSLEDLLIHSEWTREHGWRTAKRPGVDYFLRYLSQYYELVIFTTVPSAMGDPVIRKLDPFRIIMWPLFREATKYENGKYIKDLAYLNRPLEKTLIIDTNPDHVSNQPENAIVLPKWNGDPKDPHAKDLVSLIPFLEYLAATSTEDVRKVINSFKDKDIAQEFARREAISREEFNKKQGTSSKPKSAGGFLSSALGLKAAPQPGSLVMGGADPNSQQTLGEGLAQGKMLSDLIREKGQREYMRLEEEIRKNGEKWLKEMEEEEKRLMESSMKDMKKGWFGGGSGEAKK